MSLDNIQLPTIVLQDLYRKSLVDLKTNEHENDISKSIPFSFLGENRSHITILVQSEGNAYLPDEQLSFLTGVLNACKLNLSEVALVNLSNIQDPDYKKMIEVLDATKLILFGIPALAIHLPFAIPDFQVQKYDNRHYLLSPAIKLMIDDKVLKKKLWDSLKILFGIK
ncbi:MAG: hypothetical protein ABIQ56_01280 [Chitinophagaceae bacterium]